MLPQIFQERYDAAKAAFGFADLAQAAATTPIPAAASPMPSTPAATAPLDLASQKRRDVMT